MTTKLYVGNLTYDTTVEQVKELFAKSGSVISVDVINDKNTGRSKGFAFVEMDGEAAAKAAMTALNNHELDGRNIIVNEAKPREERPSGSRDSGGNNGGSSQRRY